eukprot:2159495-Amphidinium_carterae.1
MRSENLERLKRKLESDWAKATADGGSGALVDFNPSRPWNAVLRAAVADADFWTSQVKDKAFFYLASLKSSQALQSDETAQPEVAKQSTPHHNKRQASEGAGESTVRNKRSRQDMSQTGSDGLYTHNRSGNEICRRFNSGACSLPCP